MPCRSDYPELTAIESELTTIYNIYDDLNGEFKQFKYAHPKIYEVDCDEVRLEEETKALCQTLQGKTKEEITNYNYTTQRWWLNHQIGDFKRLVKESRKENFKIDKYSDYEIELIEGVVFLNELIEDAFDKIEERFEMFNKKQNSEGQINVTKSSFLQAMSSFELFSELHYLKIQGIEIEDSLRFKSYEQSEKVWKNIFEETFVDWLSFLDQFELKRYFEKFCQVVSLDSRPKHFFETVVTNYNGNKNLVFTINDTKNLIRILRILKNKILEKKEGSTQQSAKQQ